MVAFEDVPADAVGRPLDPVARDRRASRIARRPPVQLNRRRAVGAGRQVAGRSRRPGFRRGVHECRLSRTAGVHRSDPVAAGNAHRGSRIAVLRHADERCPEQAPTAVTCQHVDLVACNCAPAVRGRRVPVEVDDRRAGGRRPQVPGCSRCPGCRRGGLRVRPGRRRRPAPLTYTRRDPVGSADDAHPHRETHTLVHGHVRGRGRQQRPRGSKLPLSADSSTW